MKSIKDVVGFSRYMESEKVVLKWDPSYEISGFLVSILKKISEKEYVESDQLGDSPYPGEIFYMKDLSIRLPKGAVGVCFQNGVTISKALLKELFTQIYPGRIFPKMTKSIFERDKELYTKIPDSIYDLEGLFGIH